MNSYKYMMLTSQFKPLSVKIFLQTTDMAYIKCILKVEKKDSFLSTNNIFSTQINRN